jgi:hypothetical protein
MTKATKRSATAKDSVVQWGNRTQVWGKDEADQENPSIKTQHARPHVRPGFCGYVHVSVFLKSVPTLGVPIKIRTRRLVETEEALPWEITRHASILTAEADKGIKAKWNSMQSGDWEVERGGSRKQI